MKKIKRSGRYQAINYNNMKKAYKLAIRLDEDFPQIQHYYKLGRPIKLDMSSAGR